jgi:DNA-binding NarL/FixJ family response regulator
MGVMALRVLIVDDHASFRVFARRLLSLDGFDVVGEAADGAAGISAAHALQPDVVVLDVQLPDSEGFAVADALTAMALAPAVVLVSSRSRDDYGTQIGLSTARGFIAKAELNGETLRRVLGG